MKKWYVIDRDWKVLATFQDLNDAWKTVESLCRYGMILTVASEREFEKKEFDRPGGESELG